MSKKVKKAREKGKAISRRKLKYALDMDEWYPVYSIELLRDDEGRPIDVKKDNSDTEGSSEDDIDYGLEFTDLEKDYINAAFSQFNEAQSFIRIKRDIHNRMIKAIQKRKKEREEDEKDI